MRPVEAVYCRENQITRKLRKRCAAYLPESEMACLELAARGCTAMSRIGEGTAPQSGLHSVPRCIPPHGHGPQHSASRCIFHTRPKTELHASAEDSEIRPRAGGLEAGYDTRLKLPESRGKLRATCLGKLAPTNPASSGVVQQLRTRFGPMWAKLGQQLANTSPNLVKLVQTWADLGRSLVQIGHH